MNDEIDETESDEAEQDDYDFALMLDEAGASRSDIDSELAYRWGGL